MGTTSFASILVEFSRRPHVCYRRLHASFDFSSEAFEDPLGIALSWEEKYGKKTPPAAGEAPPDAKAEKAAPEKAAPEKAAPEKAAPEKAAPEKEGA